MDLGVDGVVGQVSVPEEVPYGDLSFKKVLLFWWSWLGRTTVLWGDPWKGGLGSRRRTLFLVSLFILGFT